MSQIFFRSKITLVIRSKRRSRVWCAIVIDALDFCACARTWAKEESPVPGMEGGRKFRTGDKSRIGVRRKISSNPILVGTATKATTATTAPKKQQQLQKSKRWSIKWLTFEVHISSKATQSPKKSKNGSRPRHLDLRRQPGHRPEPGFRIRIRISDQAGSSLRSQSSGRTGPLHLRRPDFAISSTTFSSYKSKSPVVLRCGLLGIWQSCKPRVRILPPGSGYWSSGFWTNAVLEACLGIYIFFKGINK